MKDKEKTAVLLVGGASLRFHPLIDNKPKCMIEINGKPILFWRGLEKVIKY